VSCEESTSEKQRLKVVQRAAGRCEAEILVVKLGVWTRCFTAPVEVHHMLTRARGGDVLDRVGELYHLLALCLRHHQRAHEPGGYRAGLMIEGYVTIDHATSQAVYAGPDDYLTKQYPKQLERV
jgi:hypothetical protein